MCNKSVDNYPHELKFASECYRTHKVCGKAVNTYPSTRKFVSECLMTQKKCVIKQLIDAFMHLVLFLTNIKLNKCVI